MAVKELSVYDALIEISRINDKIEKFENATSINHFVGCGPEKSKTIKGVERETYENFLKSNYDSLSHLISNLAEYKAKVALSNAVTKIVIGGKEYTIAEAIQRKNNISAETRILQLVESNISKVNMEIINHNRRVEDNLPDYLEKVASESATPEDIEKLTEKYKLDNMYVLVDPNKLLDTLEDKKQKLLEFVSSVDSKITTSNCKTLITVELED